MRGFFLKKIENLTLHTRYIKKNSIKYQITFKMGNIQIIHKKEKKKKVLAMKERIVINR